MRCRAMLVGLLALAPLGGCASSGRTAPVATPLEMRALQSRSYPVRDTQVIMKAVLAALQDEGFVVKTADVNLGLISAERQGVRPVSGAAKLGRWALIIGNPLLAALTPGPTGGVSVLEATANVSSAGDEARLRLSLQLKTLDAAARLKSVQAVTDAAVYQELFARIDKTLFLMREKVG